MSSSGSSEDEVEDTESDEVRYSCCVSISQQSWHDWSWLWLAPTGLAGLLAVLATARSVPGRLAELVAALANISITNYHPVLSTLPHTRTNIQSWQKRIVKISGKESTEIWFIGWTIIFIWLPNRFGLRFCIDRSNYLTPVLGQSTDKNRRYYFYITKSSS